MKLHEIVDQEIKIHLFPSESMPLVCQPQQSQLCRSTRESVYRCHFEIEEKFLIVAQEDNDELRINYVAFSSPTKENWMKALNDKLKSKRTNQV